MKRLIKLRGCHHSFGALFFSAHTNRSVDDWHLNLALMFMGDRNAGKTMATLAVVLLIMMFVITLLVGMRKKTDPAKQAPLHPSLIVAGQ